MSASPLDCLLSVCVLFHLSVMEGEETDTATVSPESCGPEMLFVSWLEMLCRQVAEKRKVPLLIKFSCY